MKFESINKNIFFLGVDKLLRVFGYCFVLNIDNNTRQIEKIMIHKSCKYNN